MVSGLSADSPPCGSECGLADAVVSSADPSHCEPGCSSTTTVGAPADPPPHGPGCGSSVPVAVSVDPPLGGRGCGPSDVPVAAADPPLGGPGCGPRSDVSPCAGRTVSVQSLPKMSLRPPCNSIPISEVVASARAAVGDVEDALVLKVLDVFRSQELLFASDLRLAFHTDLAKRMEIQRVLGADSSADLCDVIDDCFEFVVSIPASRAALGGIRITLPKAPAFRNSYGSHDCD